MRITSCRWHLYLPGGCPADKAAEREGIDTGTTGARQGKAVKTKDLGETEKDRGKKKRQKGKKKQKKAAKKKQDKSSKKRQSRQ